MRFSLRHYYDLGAQKTISLTGLVTIAAVLVLVGGQAWGQNILPGIDLWETPPLPGGTFDDFAGEPIPAGFFGPGSDPFVGVIEFQGNPLINLGGPDAFPADTIVMRPVPASLSSCPSEDTIPIQIVALSLVSTEPLIVTYNGGQDPELWDVHVCLSEFVESPTGTITIRKECIDGGTFDSQIPVIPKYTFIRQSDFFITTLDYGLEAIPPFNMSAGGCPWVYTPDPSLNVVEVGPGAIVDGDCDGGGDPPLPLGTSNFRPGVAAVPCDCVSPPGGSQFLAPCQLQDFPLHQHTVFPPTLGPEPEIIEAGIDLWMTPGHGTSHRDFSVDPLPAGFFGPGSDPFDGLVYLVGDPFIGSTFPADTIVRRTSDASLSGCTSEDTIPIEIVALNLVSTAPITVTYNGGQDPEIWNVKVCLSEIATQSSGTMIITKEHSNGGTYDSYLPIIPKFTFTRESDSATEILDPAPPINFVTSKSPWVSSAHPDFGAVEVTPGVVVDGDCDGSADPPLPGTSNFIPGIRMEGECGSPAAGEQTLVVCRQYALDDMLTVVTASDVTVEPITPGIDLWVTEAEDTSFIDFSAIPIPADFFEPGSEPFEGSVSLMGEPLEGPSSPSLELTDTIILRPAPALYGDCTSEDTIPIEIVGLSLVSVDPIMVTPMSGPLQAWDVKMTLSSSEPQPEGSMTIRRHCVDGGVFSSDLPVYPKLIYTRVSDSEERIAEPESLSDFATFQSPWVHTATPALRVGPGATVDGDCDGSLDPPLLGTSPNFCAGIGAEPCDCDSPPDGTQSRPVSTQSTDNMQQEMRTTLEPAGVVDWPAY